MPNASVTTRCAASGASTRVRCRARRADARLTRGTRYRYPCGVSRSITASERCAAARRASKSRMLISCRGVDHLAMDRCAEGRRLVDLEAARPRRQPHLDVADAHRRELVVLLARDDRAAQSGLGRLHAHEREAGRVNPRPPRERGRRRVPRRERDDVAVASGLAARVRPAGSRTRSTARSRAAAC